MRPTATRNGVAPRITARSQRTYLVQQTIEQQLESAIRLRTMLSAKADQDNLALAHLSRKHRSLTRNVPLAHQPSALQQVAVLIAHDNRVVFIRLALQNLEDRITLQK